MIGGLLRLYWDGGGKRGTGGASRKDVRRRPVGIIRARDAVEELAELLRVVTEESPTSERAERMISAPVARPPAVDWRAEQIEQINQARTASRQWLNELNRRIEAEQSASARSALSAVTARVRELLKYSDQAATDLDLIFVAHLMAEM